MKSTIGAGALALAMIAGGALAQTVPAAPAADVGGDWQGQMKVHQEMLPIVIHLGSQVTGDSPAERLFGVPGKLEQTGGRLKVTLQTGGVFEGALNKAGKLEGEYTRGDFTVPVVLERQLAAAPKP
jgi:hypothetical protein